MDDALNSLKADNINTKRKNILLVDDNVDAINSTRMYLEGSYNVFCATNGLAALNTLNNQLMDLIILDLNLPAIDGSTLVGVLFKNEDWKNIPVLIVSGYGIQNQTWTDNVKGFLGKPVAKEELLFNINNVI